MHCESGRTKDGLQGGRSLASLAKRDDCAKSTVYDGDSELFEEIFSKKGLLVHAAVHHHT